MTKPDARQLSIEGTAPDIRGTLQRKADAPLRPSRHQFSCNIGLFSDDAAQSDLVAMARETGR